MSDEQFIPAGILSEVTGVGSEKKVAARLTKKFEPKTWKPLYDQFILYHCMGKSNIWIAEKFDYTPQQVSNILCSQMGQALKKIIGYNIQSAQTATIQSRMESVAEKFVRKIERVVDDEELFEKAPLAIVDRGLAILKALNHLKGGGGLPMNDGSVSHSDGSGSPTVNNLQINDNRRITVLGDKAISELRDAIKFSDEAKAIHEQGLKELEEKSMNVVQSTTHVKPEVKVLPIGSPQRKVG